MGDTSLPVGLPAGSRDRRFRCRWMQLRLVPWSKLHGMMLSPLPGWVGRLIRTEIRVDRRDGKVRLQSNISL